MRLEPLFGGVVTVDGVGILHPDVEVDGAGSEGRGWRGGSGSQGKAGGFGGEFVELGFVEGELVGGVVCARVGIGHQAGDIETLGGGRKCREVLLAGGDDGRRLAVLGERAD